MTRNEMATTTTETAMTEEAVIEQVSGSNGHMWIIPVKTRKWVMQFLGAPPAKPDDVQMAGQICCLLDHIGVYSVGARLPGTPGEQMPWTRDFKFTAPDEVETVFATSGDLCETICLALDKIGAHSVSVAGDLQAAA